MNKAQQRLKIIENIFSEHNIDCNMVCACEGCQILETEKQGILLGIESGREHQAQDLNLIGQISKELDEKDKELKSAKEEYEKKILTLGMNVKFMEKKDKEEFKSDLLKKLEEKKCLALPNKTARPEWYVGLSVVREVFK